MLTLYKLIKSPLYDKTKEKSPRPPHHPLILKLGWKLELMILLPQLPEIGIIDIYHYSCKLQFLCN